jgi:predicted metal-dependent peptidase
VDEKRMFYNPDYLMENREDLNQLNIDMLYSAMAAVLKHSLRARSIPNLQPQAFNQAAGMASSHTLSEYGFKLPADHAVDPAYRGMSAEEIYKKLVDDPEDQDDEGNEQEEGDDDSQDDGSGGDDGDGDGEGQDGDGDGDGDGGIYNVDISPSEASTPEELHAAEREADRGIQMGVAAEKSFGNDSVAMRRALKKLTEAYIPPYEIMSRFIIEKIKVGNDWTRKAKRHMHMPVYMPRHKSTGILNDMIIGLDTSISVTDEMNKLHIQIIFDILEEVDQSGVTPKLTAIYCDSAVCGVEELESGQEATPYGGGGTRFDPVFTHIVENDLQPKGVIYFTDGQLSGEDRIIGKHGREVQDMCEILWVLTEENVEFEREIKALDFGECVTIQR